MPNLQLSPIVAGVWRMRDWNFDLAQRQRWIEAALELGIDSFDHADIYGDYSVEGLFGEALAAAPGLRDRLRIVTKCGIRLTSAQRPQHRIKSYDSSREHVLASVEHSLRALRTDRIDLLLIHRPDLLMDADELAATFEALKAAGKVLHVGVSNHSPSQLALLHARHRLATHQIEWSPLHLAPLDDGTLDQCQALGLRPMIWSPLAGGRLFGGGDERAERVRAALAELAPRYGDASAATLAYAWLLRHPSRPWPIAGSGRIEGLREAAASLSIRLSAEDWYAVWQAGAGREVA
ncbi:aldo/keto reductase [Lysobacter sp. BMK333-48F3]|uniref:aldo/keto reductase n=1 Tax=Lysobacter sp. BMK333-48F3 TaxID=2867962 RepID=UPI001C8C35D6|nr:aldo/keto reductase [Lysobacter sp. BMK333-48F3]MBX9400251.1 aldo/keto reductase [Lysobacter sp. BMK333-48F3]